MEEKENAYFLSFFSEGENVQALIEEAVNEMFPEGIMPEDALEGITVEQVNYTFEIDRKLLSKTIGSEDELYREYGR